MRRLWKQTPLAAIAFLSLAIAAADAIGLLDNVAWLAARVPILTLFASGSIAGYLAFEHAREKRASDRTIESVKDVHEALRRIEHQVGATLVLMSEGEIYREATRLVLSSSRSIRSTAFGLGDPQWFAPYLAALTDHAQKQATAGRSFLYKVVLSGKPSDPGFLRKSSARIDAFAARNITPMLDVRRLKGAGTAWGIDVLIVDDRHLMVVFLQARSDQLQHAITIVDNPTAVGPVVDWYDRTVIERHAERYHSGGPHLPTPPGSDRTSTTRRASSHEDGGPAK